MSKISILWVSKEPKILRLGARLHNFAPNKATNKSLHYCLFTAKTVESGLMMVRKHSPQIIVCDLNSPEIDGYFLLQEIRQNPDTSIIPVIFLSDTFDNNQYRKAMEMGADDILFAPYSESDLKNAIAARLKRYHTIAKRSQNELEQLRHNISNFLPHEILTALTGIIAGTELILNSSMALDSSVTRELLNCIKLSGKRLSRLAHNFLLYSELKTFAYDPIKIQDLQNQTTKSAQEDISQISFKQTQLYRRQEDLILDLQEASVKIGSSYLMKLVEELIDNACKFSEQGTPIKIGSKIENNHFLLSISDQGRGMTQEQIRQIGFGIQFNRSIHEQQGFGLGIAIAEILVKLHGGKLQINSVPQESTTITLSLPIPQSYNYKKLTIASSCY